MTERQENKLYSDQQWRCGLEYNNVIHKGSLSHSRGLLECYDHKTFTNVTFMGCSGLISLSSLGMCLNMTL
jgi:hypothetical protein